ncbi:hypothetical protein JAAARDRAFT_210996 [Jaapia argillacea MUCL 33604]|uniref:Uncharacterized protein n=1 Tax=Jaapia argillacea MUCL 33604 TaxID=933084 RepID=A0A067PMF3_9AGAM|nr:hypothetical protein JAAARDRAFT_210996 [Jaapia argillacea MUCL 33604]
MLSTTKPTPRRPSLQIPPSPTVTTSASSFPLPPPTKVGGLGLASLNSSLTNLASLNTVAGSGREGGASGGGNEVYMDARLLGFQGPVRTVRFPRATSGGVGAIAKSEDGTRCVVAGKESLRILRPTDPPSSPTEPQKPTSDHKSAVGRGGAKIEASRNMWTGSGLKVDSACTDVAWGRGVYANKLLTSARNGELIMWDLGKSSGSKYERKTKDHIRSIHKLSYSNIVPYYCVTGSADGDVRVWDLRTMSKSIMKIHHPTSVRSVILSPSSARPLEAVVGLDNGSIYRWDLTKGQRGQLDRLPVAHSAPILALDWCIPSVSALVAMGSGSGEGERLGEGEGWIVSGGLDRCVKVWDLSNTSLTSHIPNKPTYTLHTSYPVRKVLWRVGFECELAVVSNSCVDFGGADPSISGVGAAPDIQGKDPGLGLGLGLGLGGTGDGESMVEGRSASRVARGGGVDPVEVWDVRRGWVAKWRVGGSAVEGGVTDIAFGDSHAIWAHHSSGTFSQLDLRRSTKPIDAITRVALSWEASGGLGFVVEKKVKWEVPYDDIKPEKRQSVRARTKALGDGKYVPTTQSMGTYVSDVMMEDIEAFTRLARGYLFSGPDRRSICTRNADLAFEVGKEEAARTWLLMGSLLTDLMPDAPPTPPLSPLPDDNHGLPHSFSAPAAIPMLETSPPPGGFGKRASSSDPTIYTGNANGGGNGERLLARGKRSFERYGEDNYSGYTSSPRRGTPNSSASPSPHTQHTPLPPLSSPGTPRPTPSVFARRESGAGLFRPRSVSGLLRRPSVSTTHSSQSPTESSRNGAGGQSGHGSLRHVGEGALDDDDESGSESGGSEGEEGGFEFRFGDVRSGPGGGGGSGSGSNVYPNDGDDESSPVKPMVSPYLHPRIAPPNPSPLSRVAGPSSSEEEMEEDYEEDDEASPSPASSSDSGSDYGNDSPPRRSLRRHGSAPTSALSSRRGSKGSKGKGGKSRSRSSTLASLAAPPPSPVRMRASLAKQESYGSLRTVVAGDTSASIRERQVGYGKEGGKKPEKLRAIDTGGGGEYGSRKVSPAHRRQKSQALSELLLNPEENQMKKDNAGASFQERGRRNLRDGVGTRESKVRDLGWEALRETLEYFADEGDVQLCATLCLVAPVELQIPKRRILRFLESYLDILSRLRLHTCAAYIRKNALEEDVRNTTGIQTVVYTSCGRCRKPIVPVAPTEQQSSNPKGSFSYCPSCRSVSAKCSICHLPVKTLLFQCSVCSHGGHQECYRRYYMERPMVELPQTALLQPSEKRGRTISRASPFMGGVGQDDAAPSAGVDLPPENSDSTGLSTPHNAILGHPCAAGCGHFCWAVHEPLEVA